MPFQRPSPPSELYIKTRLDGIDLRIVMRGELDATNDDELRDALVTATAATVGLDLGGITFMGCSTLKILTAPA